MINLHFHWAWIPMVILVIVGLFFLVKREENDRYGVGGCFNFSVFIICIMASLIIGGIWIW